MNKLIIDTMTGTILNIDKCVIIDTDNMTERDLRILDDGSDSDICRVGEQFGISIEKLLEGK